ncbi:RidA family protein [Pseudomonas fluorescens]|jgi:enamine deaminase RidA (YjgF/YER057c/UK114 family)|uniref:RidA family protein n=1 Tax=Pseudomonas fluorescens TaxID=294 RepID=UPI00381D22DF
MSIQRLLTKKRLTDIVIHNGVVHLSGQLANDFDGDIRAQTLETLGKIDYLLAQAGTDRSNILSVTIYLKNIKTDFSAMNEVWEAWIDNNAVPARACVEATMYDPSVLVEMTVIAVQS